MRLQRVRAMARKEWHHLLRDPRSLGLILLMPAMMLFLYGYAIRLDVSDAPLGVLQQERTAAADAIVARFDASSAFRIAGYFPDRRSLGDAIRAGRVWAGLVVPPHYTRDLERGRARLQLLLDGVDANTARLLQNYAASLVAGYADELSPGARPVTVEDRSWFNQDHESRLAIVPGVISVVMAVIGALMTSLTMAREMELGNLVMLRTTPLTRGEFLVGKLAPYFVIGMVDLLVSAATAVYVFDVPLRGPLLDLTVVSAMFLLAVMLQGALISISAGNQMLASQMAMISTFLPAFLLSGFIFAISNMPVFLQEVTLIIPARYYVALSKAIFLKGAGITLLWAQAGALAAILLVLALLLFKRAGRLGLQQGGGPAGAGGEAG